MTEVVRARIKEKGNNNRAVAEVLFAMATEDDYFQDALAVAGDGAEDTKGNSFKTLLTDVYTDAEAEHDAGQVFETLMTEQADEDSETDEDQDFK